MDKKIFLLLFLLVFLVNIAKAIECSIDRSWAIYWCGRSCIPSNFSYIYCVCDPSSTVCNLNKYYCSNLPYNNNWPTINCYNGNYIYPISKCEVLDISGATYYLTQDILDYPNSTCIEITANNVTLDCQNHIIDGIDIQDSKGIYIRASGTRIVNCVVSDWYFGVYFSSNYNRIENVSAKSNYDAFYLPVSSYNRITLSNVMGNNKGLFLIGNSNFNIIEKTNLEDNGYGVYLESSESNVLDGINSKGNYHSGIFRFSSNNTVKNSIIENSGFTGISIYYNGTLPNLIFNNLFNNTRNFYLYNTNINLWNTTKQIGQRIYTSGLLGGNYWTTPNKTGYSDTCTDYNTDGFCDSPYSLDSNNIDYLPYAAIPQCVICPWVQTLSLAPIPIPDGGGGWYEFCCSDDNKCAGGENSCGSSNCYADALCNNKVKDEFTGYCNRGNQYLKDKCGTNCGIVDSNVCCDFGLLDSRCNGATLNTQGNCPLGYVCNSTCQCYELPPCDQYDRGYPDTTTTPAKCPDFDYTYSSANQIRDYSGIYPNCNCEVSYDSWIEELSINGITNGTAVVPQDENITLTVKIKNIGKKDQKNWLFTISSCFENSTMCYKPLTLYFKREEGKPVQHGCSAQNCQGDCQFLEENGIKDGFINPGETVKLKCFVPASYWPLTKENDKIKFFEIYEAELTQDAGNNGNEGRDSKSDALVLINEANIFVKTIEPIPIKDVNYTSEVLKNAVVNISWRLKDKLTNCVLYPCHTKVHYFESGLVPSASNITAWIEPENFLGHNTTPIYNNYTVYNASFLAEKYGYYYFRVYLWNNDRYAFSYIFGVKVLRISRYCSFTPTSNISIGPTSINLKVNLFGFVKLPENITVKCSEEDEGEIVPVNNTTAVAERVCEYPEVIVQTNYTASALLVDPYFTPCYSNITINPKPGGCIITWFSLKGEISGSNEVYPGEKIIASLSGDNCKGKRIVIKDVNNQEKCSCTFSENKCENLSCFNSPSQTGSYRYNAYMNETVVGTAFIEVRRAQTTYCGDGTCNNEENYMSCPQDCLLPEINSLNSSLEDLEEEMNEMGSAVTDLWNDLDLIKNILSETRNYYYSGDYDQAVSKYSEAEDLYYSLKDEVEKRKTEAGGIPWLLLIVVIVVIVVGVAIFLVYKLGFMENKWERLKKKWAQPYY